jgi:aldose sugar dehydrogenase
VISPASLIFCTGGEFPQWRGQVLLTGLTAQSLVRVVIDDAGAREVARYALGARLREVEQGSDGALWLLEDGAGGRLLQLRARR